MGAYWTRAHLGGGRTRIQTHTVVEVSGEAPSYNGWTLAAKVINGHFAGDADGAIVQTVRGAELPFKYRADAIDPNHCEHCNTRRHRKDTFLVVRADAPKGPGRWRQVGRQYLADFLGHQSPEALARGAEYLIDAEQACEEFSRGGHGIELVPLSEYLPWVAAALRSGGWLGRGAAREQCLDGRATADRAWMEMSRTYGKREFELEPEDGAAADRALEWSAEWLADADTNDYKLNLRNALATGVVSHRTAGIVASLIVAHQRELGRLVERQAREAAARASEYVGEVGERREFTLTLVRETGWDSDWGYTHLYTFADADGNTLIWKSGNWLGGGHYGNIEQGDSFTCRAKIKEHSIYRDTKQTVLTRLTKIAKVEVKS